MSRAADISETYRRHPVFGVDACALPCLNRTRMDSMDGARGILSSAVVDLPPGDEGALITSVETYALAVPLVKTIADSTASMPAWVGPVVAAPPPDGPSLPG